MAPVTWSGVRVSAETLAGVTVRFAVAVALYEPVTVTVVAAATPSVASPVDAVVCPCGTRTLVDPTTAVFDDVSVTLAPPCGAPAVSVTVHVGCWPPRTGPGEMRSEEHTSEIHSRGL